MSPPLHWKKKSQGCLQIKKNIGIIHIKARENNMIFTLTDLSGKTLSTISGGSLGYKNAKKSTWTTVRECAFAIGKKAREKGYLHLYVNLRGFCTKRRSAFRGLKKSRCKIERVYYRTKLPHNGCRGFKRRRK